LSISGITPKQIVKIFTKHFGFHVERSKKHILMKHPDGRIFTVPNHPSKPVKLGTMKSILRYAYISDEEFLKYL
jgi:predicted RNA binding protein YcfA (HicA-like mRNA interferase family)